MGLILPYQEGQTPLDEDEIYGLLIPTVTTRSELDQFEQQNIEDAVIWSLRQRLSVDQILSESFILDLHQRMYGAVWAWAGTYRRTNKNIGIDKWLIPVQLKQLLDDVRYWYAEKIYTPDELTIRCKHRMVSIHCFANGNGRHSRLYADIMIEKLFKLPVFTWGAGNLVKPSELRHTYLLALREADKGNYQPLIQFARS